MNWYTVNYFRDNEENRNNLIAAEWKLKTSGYSEPMVNSSTEYIRRKDYLDFIFRDTSGLTAEDYFFFFSAGYKIDIVIGILGARGCYSPWELRRTQCVSDDISEIVEYFLGNDVSRLDNSNFVDLQGVIGEEGFEMSVCFGGCDM